MPFHLSARIVPPHFENPPHSGRTILELLRPARSEMHRLQRMFRGSRLGFVIRPRGEASSTTIQCVGQPPCGASCPAAFPEASKVSLCSARAYPQPQERRSSMARLAFSTRVASASSSDNSSWTSIGMVVSPFVTKLNVTRIVYHTNQCFYEVSPASNSEIQGTVLGVKVTNAGRNARDA